MQKLPDKKILQMLTTIIHQREFTVSSQRSYIFTHRSHKWYGDIPPTSQQHKPMQSYQMVPFLCSTSMTKACITWPSIFQRELGDPGFEKQQNHRSNLKKKGEIVRLLRTKIKANQSYQHCKR